MQPASPFRGAVEFRHDFAPRPDISHVIFDFDGTLSWLRHGWPDIMCALFREYLAPSAGETEVAFHDRLMNDILSLNGKPSIHQMLLCCERVRERGGVPPDPEALLHEYQGRLDGEIRRRSETILNRSTPPDEFVIHGARPLLEKLLRRGLTLIILSGTIEHRVQEEAALLGLARLFGAHIYGSGDKDFSKQLVIERILREEQIEGRHLLSFGDGPVEIHDTKAAGGLAIAVASDEAHNGSGLMDPWKRRQLLAAGADAAIADYRDADALLERLLGQ